MQNVVARVALLGMKPQLTQPAVPLAPLIDFPTGHDSQPLLPLPSFGLAVRVLPEGHAMAAEMGIFFSTSVLHVSSVFGTHATGSPLLKKYPTMACVHAVALVQV
jgi:hypothetical protein